MAKWSNDFDVSCILVISLIILTARTTSAQQQDNCSTYTFSNNNRYASCITLPVLNSFLHWNYHASNHSIDIAYRHTGVSPSNWVAWAINPTGSGMDGAQCLVALRNSTGIFRAYTSPVPNKSTRLAEGTLSFGVPRLQAEFRNNNNEAIIFASVQLPAGRTSFNQVWQIGPISQGVPQRHGSDPSNLGASGNIDFVSGNGGGAVSPTTSPPASPQQDGCSSYQFRNNNRFATCTTLPVLNSFLHWNYHASNNSIDLAYRHTGVSTSNWVAWAINPTGSGMDGAQCLVALSNSSGVFHAYTSPVPNKNTQLQEGSLSFGVPRIQVDYSNTEAIIFASVQLPAGRTSFNHVWQIGPVSQGLPQAHTSDPSNLAATGNIDFVSGQVSGGGGGAGSLRRRRNVHGVLNVVSWGILMPLGAVIARYLKVFKSADPAWFYLHVACQTSAYIVGVAGWGTGLKLGSDSKGITYDTHRAIGITMFALGTLQVFALLLRPKPDHKFRFYWNIYHYAIGYAVISLSIANIFKGFDILQPEKKWKNAYIGIIIAIGAAAVILEVFTWFIVLKRKKQGSSTDKYPHNSNGANGVNGYGARQQGA